MQTDWVVQVDSRRDRTPACSIVLPVFNSRKFIPATLESISRQQTSSRFDLIVADDGSSDGTSATVAECLRTDIPGVLLRSEKNHGVSRARNAAISHARGKLIAFIDSDDVWYPTKLEEMIGLRRQFGVGVFCHAEHLIDEAGAVTGLLDAPFTEFATVPPLMLLAENCLSTSAMVLDRSCLPGRSPFKIQFEPAADYALWLRLALREKVMYTPRILGAYRKRAGSVSSDPYLVAIARQRVLQAMGPSYEDCHGAHARRVLAAAIADCAMDIAAAE